MTMAKSVFLLSAKGAVRAPKRARNTRAALADGSSVLRVLLVSLCVVVALPLIAQQNLPNEKPTPLFKQGSKDDSDPNMRAVAGVVSDETGTAVEGAVVKIKDTKSLKIRSYITQKDGVYRFNGVSTNVDYEIRADFKGQSSETRTLSVFDSRKQARVNLQLEPLKGKAEK